MIGTAGQLVVEEGPAAPWLLGSPRFASSPCRAASGRAWAQTAFYRASSGEIAGPPGTLIRSEPMGATPAGARAFRVLYRSTGLQGEPIAVSGIVIIPPGPAPPGGRPIVAWAHPTTGSRAALCAVAGDFRVPADDGLASPRGARPPSLPRPIIPASVTPGPHPYLVGVSEGRAVLDSVLVARAMPGCRRRQPLRGVGPFARRPSRTVCGAIGKKLCARARSGRRRRGGACHRTGYADGRRLQDQRRQESDRDDAVGRGRAYSVHRSTVSWCRRRFRPSTVWPTNAFESIFDIRERRRTERPLEQNFLSVENIAVVEPWKTLAMRNTPGVLPSGIPLFLAQGVNDDLVLPEVTRALLQAAMQGRRKGADADASGRRPRFCRPRRRRCRSRVDDGPLCRPAPAKRLRRRMKRISSYEPTASCVAPTALPEKMPTRSFWALAFPHRTTIPPPAENR